MRHLGNPPFISFWLKIYPVFVCASTFKVTPNRLYFSLAASDASRQQRINTMNEVGRGVMVLRGGGEHLGPSSRHSSACYQSEEVALQSSQRVKLGRHADR